MSIMTQTLIFDRQRYTDKLRDNGIDEKAARAHGDALDGALREAVATKADVQALRTDMDSVKIALSANIVALRTELKADIVSLRAELKADIVSLRAELKADIATLKTEIADVRVELKADIAALKTEINDVRLELKHDIAALETRFDARLDTSIANLHRDLTATMATKQTELLKWMIGSQVGLLVAIMTLIKLFKV